MTEWDKGTFEEHLGKRIPWGLVTGRDFSGKDIVSSELCGLMNSNKINFGAISEDLKKSLGTEEEPFEGDVPVDKLEGAVADQVASDRAAGKKITYIFDSWPNKTLGEFLEFAHKNFGLPTFAIHCSADKKVVEDRYKKANETEEIAEDVQADLDNAAKLAEKWKQEVEA